MLLTMMLWKRCMSSGEREVVTVQEDFKERQRERERAFHMVYSRKKTGVSCACTDVADSSKGRQRISERVH
jgi:hypothetical protein